MIFSFLSVSLYPFFFLYALLSLSPSLSLSLSLSLSHNPPQWSLHPPPCLRRSPAARLRRSPAAHLLHSPSSSPLLRRQRRSPSSLLRLRRCRSKQLASAEICPISLLSDSPYLFRRPPTQPHEPDAPHPQQPMRWWVLLLGLCRWMWVCLIWLCFLPCRSLWFCFFFFFFQR